jgi:copper homeostasis protein
MGWRAFPRCPDVNGLKSQIPIPIYVMIRPDSENFCYDGESFEAMKTTLITLKDLEADGFALGILMGVSKNPSQNTATWIDVTKDKELVELAEGKPCTFHRAFDCIPESHWDTALVDLAKCGFASILTSGGPWSDKAIDCVDKLADLDRRLDLQRLHSQNICNLPQISVGGGGRSNDVRLLRETSNARVFHPSGLISSSEIVAKSKVERLRDILRGNSL